MADGCCFIPIYDILILTSLKPILKADSPKTLSPRLQGRSRTYTVVTNHHHTLESEVVGFEAIRNALGVCIDHLVCL